MITIYGNSRCGWCIRAKRLAERYDVKYVWKDTDEDVNLNEMKKMLPNAKSIPQIWWYDRHVGGYEDLVNEIENTIGGYGDQKF